MKAAKIKDWPLATVRSDGMPAVWISHDMWLILRPALVREYLQARRQSGETRARIKARKPDEILDGILGRSSTKHSLHSIMGLYEIIARAYLKPEHRTEYHHLSPTELVNLGAEKELQAFEETYAKLTEGKA